MLEFVLGCIVILVMFGIVWGAFLYLMSLFFGGGGQGRNDG